jgi:hypothetical protein
LGEGIVLRFALDKRETNIVLASRSTVVACDVALDQEAIATIDADAALRPLGGPIRSEALERSSTYVHGRATGTPHREGMGAPG